MGNEIDDKKTIVVLGAGKGLGASIARRFGKAGYRAILIARSAGAATEIAERLAVEGVEAYAYVLDVTKDADVYAAFGEIREAYGEPDVVVYNVGNTAPDPEDMDTDELRRHFESDLFGAFTTICAAATDGFAWKKGSILLTGGIAAECPFPGYDCLAMTKAALRNLARVKNTELSEKGIFVGTVMVCGVIGGDEHFAPDNIAERFWEMNEERTSWEMKYE